MPEIKINKSNVSKRLTYKCFLLNVRSHRDYVCLEVDGCPSGLDFSSSEEFSIDSSQVVMPVLDKIRFNIKGTNSSMPFWFEKKLEVFAEGHQIFPRRYCTKCERLSRDKQEDLQQSNLNSIVTETGLIDACEKIRCELISDKYNDDPNKTVTSPTNNILTSCDAEKPSLNQEIKEIYYTIDDQEDLHSMKSVLEESMDNLLPNEHLLKNKFISKSEMLTVDHDSGIDEVVCSSLPDVFIPKENTDKSVQTRVILGSRDFSETNNPTDVDLLETNKSYDNYPSSHVSNSSRKSISSTKIHKIIDDVNFIHTANERFKTFNVNEKLRYWSLIKSARQMMKMNQDVIELNSILKSLAVEKSLDNSNLIGSLSPVNLILKLKSLNRSSSLYSLISEIPDNDETKRLRKQWYEQNRCDYDKCKLSYFNKLSSALADDESKNEEKMLPDTGHNALNCPSSDSLLSMGTLYSLQKRMLVMMESFLRKDDTEQSAHF